jgi:hypothetical protein
LLARGVDRHNSLRAPHAPAAAMDAAVHARVRAAAAPAAALRDAGLGCARRRKANRLSLLSPAGQPRADGAGAAARR